MYLTKGEKTYMSVFISLWKAIIGYLQTHAKLYAIFLIKNNTKGSTILEKIGNEVQS